MSSPPDQKDDDCPELDPIIVEASITHPFNVHDLVTMKRVGAPVLSPDGKHVVFSVKDVAAESYRSTTSLWYTSTALLDQPKRLTSAEFKSDSSPCWLNNRTVAFLSTRSGSSQVWTIAIDGGEAMQLTNYPIDVANLKYNAVQCMLLISCAVYPDIKDNVFAETAARNEQSKSQTFKHYTKLMVRHWSEWRDDTRSHVFAQRVQLGTQGWSLVGTAQDVMPGFATDCPIPPFTGAEGYDISPGGDEIAFSARVPVADSSLAWTTKSHVCTVSVARAPAADGAFDGWTFSEPKTVCPDELGANTCPLYSPCGRLLVWLSMARAGYESDRNRPMVLHRESGQIHSPVHDHVDQSFDAVVFAPPLAGPNAPSTLYMTTTRNGRHMVFHMQLDKTGALLQEPLPLITQHFNSNVLALGRDRLLFTRDSFFAPAELFVCKIDGTQERRVTNFNTAALTAMRMGDCTDAYFRGALDEPVHAWLFRPIDFDPRRTYPLAVIVHGGPQGAIEDHWHYRWNPQIYAAQGFAVLCINFHGSTGFGQAFCDSIRGEWGTLPYEDIMKGVAYFCKNYSWIDESRAGALGASYGGWMMNWLNGHTDKFRCLVNHCGIFSQTAMHCSTEELYFTEWEMRGCSWDPAAIANYQRFSPSTYVANWKTPTMVVHGGRDYRVPDVEGLQTFSALQRLGVPSELLYFPDECHWVLGAQNSVTWHEHVLAWLHRWLDEAKAEQE